MKTIYLVRHAKSSWKDIDLNDEDRPLNKRGEHDAPLMGKLLKKTNVKTDLIISSPAKRAFATAEKIAAEINYDKRKIETDNDIYLATSKELSDFTSRLNNKFNDVMIFGHNPGLTDFLNHLCTENITNMPTGSVACIEFQIDDWSEIKTHKGKLKFFEYPKKNF